MGEKRMSELHTGHFRHEYKYPLTHGERMIEEARIRSLMKKDKYVGVKGYYTIRSLYFDDYESNAYVDNINGTDNREKFRIRIYNADASVIKLEAKKKYRGMTQKSSCKISVEQCRSLMEGEAPKEIGQEQVVLQKLCILMKSKLMKPVVIVEYDRIPYVYRRKDANVRVTFDSNIVACKDADAFLEDKILGRRILPHGKGLMEVKFDGFLPDEIYALLKLENLSINSFSKYALCRRYMV